MSAEPLPASCDQTVLLANERASAMFGVPMSQAPGRSAPDFWVNAEDRKRLIEGLRDTGLLEGFEAELKTAAGKRFWGLVSASMVDFEGVPAIVVGVHDITARRHERRRRYRSVLQYARGGHVQAPARRARRSASRGSDILARYGGEELVLLLPEADAKRRPASSNASASAWPNRRSQPHRAKSSTSL